MFYINSNTSNTVKKKKLSYIEGVRGTAAVMVVIYHYLLAFYPALANGKPSEVHLYSAELVYYKSPFLFLTNGQFFVYIFFILSGYVLSYQSVANKEKGYLTSAIIRRFPRLYIPVFFSILFAFLLSKLSLNYEYEVSTVTKSMWLSSLKISPSIASFFKSLFVSSIFLGDGTYNTVLWSISVELYGSMLVFALIALMNNNLNPIILLVIVLLVLVINSKFEYCAFVLGMFLNYSDYLKFRGRTNKILNFLLLLIGLFLGGFPHIYHLSTPTIKGTFFDFLDYKYIIKSNGLVNGIGAFSVILSVKNSTFLKNIFSGSFLNFVGSISFSMYLIHALVLQSLSSYLFLRLLKNFSYNTAFLLQCIPTVIVIILLSYLMTIFIDKRSVSISKYIYEYYFPQNKLPLK